MSEKATLLVVDDDVKLLACISRYLSGFRERFNTRTALTGEEAVRVLEKERIDILLTDVCLPGVDGIDVMRRALVVRPKTMVIAMTGYASPEVESRAIRQGAHMFIEKPFELHELGRLLEEAWLSTGAPSVARFDIVNLTFLMARAKKNRNVCVRSANNRGFLAFKGGAVVRASTPRHHGEEAFLEMSEWDGGWFEEVDHTEAYLPEDRVTVSTDDLLRQASRLLTDNDTHPFGGRLRLLAGLRESFEEFAESGLLSVACVVQADGSIEAESRPRLGSSGGLGETAAVIREIPRLAPDGALRELVIDHEAGTVIVVTLGIDRQLVVMADRRSSIDEALAAVRRLKNRLLSLRRCAIRSQVRSVPSDDSQNLQREQEKGGNHEPPMPARRC